MHVPPHEARKRGSQTVNVIGQRSIGFHAATKHNMIRIPYKGVQNRTTGKIIIRSTRILLSADVHLG